MNPERWRQIEELYHAALEREPGARQPFLDEACGDVDLRQEVELLLARNGATSGDLLDSTVTQPATGAQLGPYKIEAPIGAGGMGQVFKARDTRLGREVAIKIADEKFSSRFEREARAISALNHPNICTLYDVGPNYLVMELVEGETLAACLKKGALPMERVLSYGAQITDALSAAHAKGIIHRDLKPGNIMITKTGVKVLDFGLAKMATPGDETLTHTNAVMGTPAYMAPEQFEGKEADARTDLLALGLVLYEMACGKRPYPGASFGDMLVKDGALHPEPPSRVRRGGLTKLDTIILRLLQRDPDLRFQTAEELLDQLSKLQQPRRITARGIAAAALLSALVGTGAWWLAGRRGQDKAAPLEYIRLTNFPDSVHSPALSKDGKMLAFVRGPVTFLGGPGQIYLKVLPDGQPTALTQDTDQKIAPVFSPDGSRIVYTAPQRNWTSLSVPIAGGMPAVMMPNAAALRWVGPGQVLFSEAMRGFHMGLVTASESRAASRPVYIPESPSGMAHFSELSPDGKFVLAVEMVEAVWQPCRLVPFDGSSKGRQVGPAGALCTSATWSPDGQWMYFAAELNGESHLWRQRFPDGTPEQLTSGLDQEWGVAVDPDGRSLITSAGSAQSTVWYHDDKGDRPVSVEGYAYRPLVSPSWDKVFYLVRKAVRGSLWSGEVWSMDLASGRNERLFPEFLVQYYHVSRDGKTMVFDVLDQSGKSKIWIAPVDRSRAPRKLSTEIDVDDQHPLLGRSGAVYFMRLSGKGRFLMRVQGDGSGVQELRPIPGGYILNLSPDEKWAAIWGHGEGVTLHPLGEGPSQSLCQCAAGPIFQDSPRIAWSGDGKFLILNAGGSMAGLGTIAVPWPQAEGWPSGRPLSGPELRKVPGVILIREQSVAPGPTVGIYAFARSAEQSNLYRVRLK